MLIGPRAPHLVCRRAKQGAHRSRGPTLPDAARSGLKVLELKPFPRGEGSNLRLWKQEIEPHHPRFYSLRLCGELRNKGAWEQLLRSSPLTAAAMRYHAAGAMMRSALALALACSAFACSSRCHAFQSLRSLGVLSAVDAPGSRSRMGGSHSIRRPANAPFPAIGPLRMAAAGKMQLRGGGGAPGCEDTEQQEPLSAVLKEVSARNSRATSGRTH